MTTVATESPLVKESYLPDALANTLGFHTKLADPNQVSVISNSPASKFILNKSTFGNLKVYLEQVQKFPESWTRFEVEYPPAVFKRWTEEVRPGLYEDLRSTLVLVRVHCSDFQTKSLPKMNNLSGSIANFAERNSASIKKITDNMVIVADPTKTRSDPVLLDAVDAVWEACKQIIDGAKKTQEECILLQAEFNSFRLQTEKDKVNLQKVNDESDRAWPTPAKLSADRKRVSDQAYAELAPMFEEQLKTSKRHDGMMSWKNSIGADLYYDNDDQLKRLKELDGKFQGKWAVRQNEYATAMAFKATSATLERNIDSVQDSIDAAVLAIKDLADSFGMFSTEIKAISDSLEEVHGYIVEDSARRRARANNRFADANTKWQDVRQAAEWFQKNGIELSDSLKKKVEELSTKPTPPQRLEIEGANFGSLDVTAYAPVLWHMETYLSVNGTARAFSDPWPTIEKTLSCLYRWGSTRRILICMEYTDTNTSYRIEEGDKWRSNTGKAVHEELVFSAAPSSSKVQILAIVWGLSTITDGRIWDKLYGCVNTEVTFGNDLFGSDSWKYAFKSGVIYYQLKGGDGKVLQFAGKEGKTVFWRV